MSYIKTKALIIGKKLHKEHDKNLLLLLEDGRKIEANIRKARDTTAKWGAVTEPVSKVEIDVYERAGRHTITGIEIDKFYSQSDYSIMVAQEFVCEVIDRTTPFSHQEDELFDIAQKTLDNLRKDNIGCSMAWFLFQILRIHGYPLHVEHCASCGKHIESDAAFDVSLGSVVCRDCRTADCIAFPLTAVTAVKTFDNPCINECLPKKMVQGIIKLELRILCSRFDAKIATSLHIQSLC